MTKSQHTGLPFFLVLLFGMSMPFPLYAADIHVPADQPTIQAAMDSAVNGDTIIISDGIYTGEDNKNIYFLGKAVVVRSENGAESCIIDCENEGRGFVFGDQEGSDSGLQGLTIRNGNMQYGGAVFCGDNTGMFFTDCIFEANQCLKLGGAVICSAGSSPAVTNCVFQKNRTTGEAGGGGAMYICNSNAKFQDCSFLQNVTNYSGGGLYMIGEGCPSIMDCQFIENRGRDAGGVANLMSSAKFLRCLFEKNVAETYWGGGISSRDSHASYEDCIFRENRSSSSGAGLHVGGECSVTVKTSVFEKNFAQRGAGIACLHDSVLTIESSEFTDNESLYGGSFYLMNASVILQDCDVSRNIARESGGGFYLLSSSIMATDCSIIQNRAKESGGGIYFSEECTGVIGGAVGSENTIMDNRAGIGAQLFSSLIPETPIDVTFNIFQCDPQTDYSVYPLEAFRLDGATYERESIPGDVFVSPDGDNESDGLTPETAFKSLYYALRRIKGTPALPVTIHVAAGTYSPSLTQDVFPLPLLPYVTIKGDGSSVTIIDAEGTGRVLRAWGDTDAHLSGLTFTGGDSEYGGGLRATASTFRIEGCSFENNLVLERGGGLLCEQSDLIMVDSCIRDNTSEKRGGGIHLLESAVDLTNCLIVSNNSGELGGGVFCFESTGTFQNCTLNTNTSAAGGGVYCISDPCLTLIDCIVWGDVPDEIAGEGTVNATYSDVQGGYPGAGNLAADPLFVTGENGDHYLSQIGSGQSSTSPCVDMGSAVSDLICYVCSGETVCLNTMSTRTDAAGDAGQVDLGYHYPSDSDCTVLGCSIEMPSHDFGPGETCSCLLTICNPLAQSYDDIPVFAILDVYGNYYFAPSFSEFDYIRETVTPGLTFIQILEPFTWPEGVGSATGIVWYAGMTDPGMSQLFGEIGTFVFGWHS
jgi:predicted outer membrane repeat protein